MKTEEISDIIDKCDLSEDRASWLLLHIQNVSGNDERHFVDGDIATGTPTRYGLCQISLAEAEAQGMIGAGSTLYNPVRNINVYVAHLNATGAWPDSEKAKTPKPVTNQTVRARGRRR